MRVPERMRRPSAAREALRLTPLVETGWADSSGVEGVPLIPAVAEPLVFFTGRPAAERTTDTRAGGVLILFFLKFSIQHDRFRGVSHKIEYSSSG